MRQQQIIHVLGNGPSVQESWKGRFSKTDIVIGNNFPPCPVDFSVITDISTIKAFHQEKMMRPTYPLLISDKAYSYAKKHNLLERFELKDVFKLIKKDSDSLTFNSGQHTLIYIMRVLLPFTAKRSIFFYGFDSLWETTMESLEDNVEDRRIKTKKAAKITRIWREHWNELLLFYGGADTATFTFMVPKEKKLLLNENKNVKTYHF